jgi:hypothetical protein
MHASAPSDGNGYCVATLIPATASGTVHSTTGTKSGMTSQTITNATVLAGGIVRYDFVLNILKLSVAITRTNTAVVSRPSPSPGWTPQQLTNLAATNWGAPGTSVNDNGTSKSIIVNPPSGSRLYVLCGL